ncbi:MAG: PDZ domain-containing protein, partial [Pseudanabaena sp.]
NIPSSNSPRTIPSTATPTTERYLLGVVLTNSLTVYEVRPNSLASRMGLQKGDRLVSLNGIPIRDAKQIIGYLSQRPSEVLLTVAKNTGITNYQIKF